MIAAYIIAGAILGMLSPLIVSVITYRPMTASTSVAYMLAFVGGVAGHLLFNLVYN
jgi:hypothetical protein